MAWLELNRHMLFHSRAPQTQARGQTEVNYINNCRPTDRATKQLSDDAFSTESKITIYALGTVRFSVKDQEKKPVGKEPKKTSKI